MSNHAPMKVVAREIKRLDNLLTKGLADCYEDDMFSYWCDFGADFSWNDNSIIEMQSLLDDTTWVAKAAEVKAKLDIDFVDAINKSLSPK